MKDVKIAEWWTGRLGRKRIRIIRWCRPVRPERWYDWVLPGGWRTLTMFDLWRPRVFMIIAVGLVWAGCFVFVIERKAPNPLREVK